jgi:rare lipoprotein A (peptidoglycan hydrolase)
LGTRLLVATLALALAVCSAAPAAAAPPATARAHAADAREQAQRSQAALSAAVRDYAAARARVSTLDGQLAENSARLDEAVDRQQRLQRRLGSRASGMYRRGRFEFIEVLTASVSFDQFAALWDALIRINRRDAQAIQELKRTRAQIAETAGELLKRQAEASTQLRKLADAKARAERQLGRDRAAYASYRQQVAAIDAQAETRARTARTAGAVGHPVAIAGTAPTGSGRWNTAVASCYGMGSVGHSTASGQKIRADSMIVAHKTLPFGTLVEFSYGGHRGVASVQDRGPYVPGRSFDLGPGIARVLGIEGVESVSWRVVSR